ncbi:MAG: hypothetical protein LW878_13500 [Proteobacteria bacterium]|nr:hypothetical protein [Pseudomonadota bacterium]
MRALFLILTVFFTLLSQAQAYELLMIQTVSTSRKSFVTRSGKRQGITENFTATFPADNVSLIAKARTVTSQFTQWEVVNPQAQVPFDPGTLVTYHPAEEYVWALSPEKARIKYIEDLRPTMKRSWLLKSAVTRGLNESVSNVEAQNPNRGGVALDILYEKQFTPHFAWDAGLRYESEVVNLVVGTLNTQRVMIVGDLIYDFDPVEEFYNARVFIGAGMGIGQSSTNVQGIVQSGTATLLPAAKLGLTLPFNKEWDFIAESAFETLRTEEVLEERTNQSTTQSNLRIGIGVRKFF